MTPLNVGSTSNFTAKKKMHIGENWELRPSSAGRIRLQISLRTSKTGVIEVLLLYKYLILYMIQSEMSEALWTSGFSGLNPHLSLS